MSVNTRWKCPTTGSIIDFEPTAENFFTFRKTSTAFATMAMKGADGSFLIPDGYSPWDHEVMMVQYEQ